MSEDKLCLQRDTTEGRCLEEECTPYETSRRLELKPDRENVTRSGTGSITYGTNVTPDRAHCNDRDWKRVSTFSPTVVAHDPKAANSLAKALSRGGAPSTLHTTRTASSFGHTGQDDV